MFGSVDNKNTSAENFGVETRSLFNRTRQRTMQIGSINTRLN